MGSRLGATVGRISGSATGTRLRRRLRAALGRGFATDAGRDAFEALASDLGYDLVPRDWASPMPDLSLLDDGAWDRASELAELPPIEAERQLAYLEALAPALADFDPPLAESEAGPGEFYLRNLAFEAVDAHVLYAIVRGGAPRTVIEIGSGHSTLLLATAVARNRAEGKPARLITIDPYPSPRIEGLDLELRRQRGNQVPVADFEALGAGDILFCDTSHTVKLGSEVNHVILEVLPRLAPGVLVHFHDVFLPWEYPRHWAEESRWFWTEQYLLQAFLAFNREFEILFSSQIVARTEPARLAELIPAFTPGRSMPASFWIRRRGEPS